MQSMNKNSFQNEYRKLRGKDIRANPLNFQAYSQISHDSISGSTRFLHFLRRVHSSQTSSTARFDCTCQAAMDPDRVHAYLQAACAGLGFDIGEVWWTSDENGSSSMASIEEDHRANQEKSKTLRFVQLYTSRSYENRRAELVNPPPSEDESDSQQRPDASETLNEHVLSPRLVDAISRTTQVIWATTKKQEGLTGRSDIRLQTAVGMPVAVDEDGNMCIVVMFSPNNIQSSDEAMLYLQSISQSATSSNIPCLLPVFDSRTTYPVLQPGIIQTMQQHGQINADQEHQLIQMPPSVLGEGVVARFVTLDERHNQILADFGASSKRNDYAYFDGLGQESAAASDEGFDVFDEASYGIWSTIMESIGDTLPETDPSEASEANEPDETVRADASLLVVLPPPSPFMSNERKDRLGEFCEAFLEMSVFDYADVWIPATENGFPDCLRYVMSSVSTVNAGCLNELRAISVHALIKFWTGAVGRAYASGNPVWSTDPNIFTDAARFNVFEQSNIKTILAVPVFAKGSLTPACVVACYSLVQTSSIPFVLKFVQQALSLLWQGIDGIELHESFDQNIFLDVAPADLGEMAADVEMQQHFMSKKRPHHHTADELVQHAETTLLANGLHRIQLPSGETIDVPLQLPSNDMSEPLQAEVVQKHMAQALRHARDFQRGCNLISRSPSAKRQQLLPTALSGSIGQPLQRPRGLPKSIVPSMSSRFESPYACSQRSTLSNCTIVQTDSGQVPILHPNVSLEPNPLDPNQQYHISWEMQASGPPARSNGDINRKNPDSVNEDVAISFCLSPQNVCRETGNAEAYDGNFDNTSICRIVGCSVLAVARRPYCEHHIGSRQCEHGGCGKCAQGSTRFCIAHGGGRRCTIPGCDKGARDKFFCAAHGGGKRCSHGGCTKSAVGGSDLCTAHGGGRRCAIDGCEKSAQSSTNFCVNHGGGKKCAKDGCERVARGRTQFCAKHGGGVRCKLDGCNRVAIGRMQLCRTHGGMSTRSRNTAIVPPVINDAIEGPLMILNEAIMQRQALESAHHEHELLVGHMTGI
ncbi:hypothetical protein MPSEU_000651600 [Mayamaea pseudoterrestris]|nr:hypothetical protein MPSEU_000651600 [Mayamaea pseudoterrestris]